MLTVLRIQVLSFALMPLPAGLLCIYNSTPMCPPFGGAIYMGSGPARSLSMGERTERVPLTESS